MRIDRLKTLLKFLHENVDERHYDHGAWGHNEVCGTVCCAAGWATTIPEFNEAGLTGTPNANLIDAYTPHFPDPESLRGYAMGDAALKLFFELNASQVEEIFHFAGYNGHYPDLEAVKRKIGDVITAESLRLAEVAALEQRVENPPPLPEVTPAVPAMPDAPETQGDPNES